jgi:hypothetical protein
VTRARRSVAALCLAAVGLAAGCGVPELERDGAAVAATDALTAAGLDPGEVTEVDRRAVDIPPGPGERSPRQVDAWVVALPVDGEPWEVGIHPGTGAVVRTFEPAGTRLDQRGAEALAAHRHNPRADEARRQRRTAAVAAVLVGLSATYVLLRTLRLRDERRPTLTGADRDHHPPTPEDLP